MISSIHYNIGIKVEDFIILHMSCNTTIMFSDSPFHKVGSEKISFFNIAVWLSICLLAKVNTWLVCFLERAHMSRSQVGFIFCWANHRPYLAISYHLKPFVNYIYCNIQPLLDLAPYSLINLLNFVFDVCNCLARWLRFNCCFMIIRL